MSYDIGLKDPTTGEVVEVARHEEGGTYAVGGCTDASLNITYNYSGLFRFFVDQEEGIRWLYGKTGEEVVPRLQSAIESLEKIDKAPWERDYWAPTSGNACHALKILLAWAEQHPTAVFEGD